MASTLVTGFTLSGPFATIVAAILVSIFSTFIHRVLTNATR
jgi:uncharacterized membrane protein YvlD (DUF360 family)